MLLSSRYILTNNQGLVVLSVEHLSRYLQILGHTSESLNIPVQMNLNLCLLHHLGYMLSILQPLLNVLYVYSLKSLHMYLINLFSGLKVAEAAKLCSYMHFRDATRLGEKSLLQKANLDKSIDFLDPIDEDIPKGIFLYATITCICILLKGLIF